MPESATPDRIVLITGASRGIGFATAQTFLKDGARLVIGARDAARLSAAEHALAAHGPGGHGPSTCATPRRSAPSSTVRSPTTAVSTCW